jgi:ribose-phosphate pyrophosphokinase
LNEIPDKSEIVVVSPDAGGLSRAKSFHKHFDYHGYGGKVGLAMLNKERKEANKIEKMELVGNVEGKTCIIIDDMIDTAGTLCEAARVLKDKGAKKVYAFASHGLFSGPAAERIRDSALEKVITTDSIPLSQKFKDTVGPSKFQQVSLDLLLAETIRRVH